MISNDLIEANISVLEQPEVSFSVESERREWWNIPGRFWGLQSFTAAQSAVGQTGPSQLAHHLSFLMYFRQNSKKKKKKALKPSSLVDHKREKSVLDDCFHLKQDSLKIVRVTRNFTSLSFFTMGYYAVTWDNIYTFCFAFKIIFLPFVIFY